MAYTNSQDDFSLCDMYLAAALVVAGLPMVNTTVLSNRVYFHFNKNDELISRIKHDFLARPLPIDALTYSDQLKSLKSLCAEILHTSRR